MRSIPLICNLILLSSLLCGCGSGLSTANTTGSSTSAGSSIGVNGLMSGVYGGSGTRSNITPNVNLTVVLAGFAASAGNQGIVMFFSDAVSGELGALIGSMTATSSSTFNGSILEYDAGISSNSYTPGTSVGQLYGTFQNDSFFQGYSTDLSTPTLSITSMSLNFDIGTDSLPPLTELQGTWNVWDGPNATTNTFSAVMTINAANATQNTFQIIEGSVCGQGTLQVLSGGVFQGTYSPAAPFPPTCNSNLAVASNSVYALVYNGYLYFLATPGQGQALLLMGHT